MKNLENISTDSLTNTISKIDVNENQSVLPADDWDMISNERIIKGVEIRNKEYMVISDVRKGGMGSVWQVRQKGQKAELAMKRPQPKYFAEGSRERKERFIRECESWIGLGLHPGIVACYYVRDIGGVPTIFSEWMRGGSLEDRIKDDTLYDGTEEVKQERLLGIAIQSAGGLEYAHGKGLIHQDVKPDNLLLTEDFDVKVADFGLSGAKNILSEPASDPGNGPQNDPETEPGLTVIAGSGGYSPTYCSPEQRSGRRLSRRTDIYSWAVSMMEMYLGGRKWKRGEEAGVHCGEYLKNTKVPASDDLKELLIRCMAAEEENRPHDFGEIVEKLLYIYRGIFGREYETQKAEAAEGSADSLNNQAVSYMEIGLSERAQECWEEAQRTDPSHAETLYNRSLINWRNGNLTGRQARNRLLCHPYFARTEMGKRKLDLLVSEAGKRSFNEVVCEGAPVCVADLSICCGRRQSPDKIYWTENYSEYLWHGKLYIIAPFTEGKIEGENAAPILLVFDAGSGKLVSERRFKDILRPGSFVRKASLSQDCRFAFFTFSDGLLASYSLEEDRIRYCCKSNPVSRYDMDIPLRGIGTDGRFAWRYISHGLGHGAPPTVETFDLRTGEIVDNYSDRQLVNAGSEGEKGEPEENRYYRSLCDGLRVIPVRIEPDGSLVRCGMDAGPLGNMSEKIVHDIYGRLNPWATELLRITSDGLVWRLGDEGVMNYDPVSGKCLRSFERGKNTKKILVDDDGLGFVRILTENEGEEYRLSWQYMRIMPVSENDQAEWVMSDLENYDEYAARTERIRSLEAEFKNSMKGPADNENLCRIYSEASEIRRFFGSSAEKFMVRELEKTCRQKEGFVVETEDTEVSQSDPADIEKLKEYGMCSGELPQSVISRLRSVRWKANYDRPCVSSDGKRALVSFDQNLVQAKERRNGAVIYQKEIQPPLGEGLYLMDLPSEKLYRVYNMTPVRGSGAAAIFCKDTGRFIDAREYLDRTGAESIRQVCGGDIISTYGGGRYRFEVVKKQVNDHSWHDLTVGFLYGGEEKVPALLWAHGCFAFADEASAKAFIGQPGGRFTILAASGKHGLIVYKEEAIRSNRFKVWSVDEQKNILDSPESYSSAGFKADDGENIRFVVLPEDIRTHKLRYKIQMKVYQFSCSYTAEPNLRRTEGNGVEWPKMVIEESGWRKGGRDEQVLADEAVRLSGSKKIEELHKAFEDYCELEDRFGKNGRYDRDRDAAAEKLNAAFKKMASFFRRDGETLRKYLNVYGVLSKVYPEQKTCKWLLANVQVYLARVLAVSGDKASMTEALRIYSELARVNPEDREFAKMRDSIQKALKMMK